MKRNRITGTRRQRFLAVLAETANVSLAAKAAGVSRTGIYAHREVDDGFAAAWEQAEQTAADRLEAEAWRRGVEGVPEPLVSAGRLVTGEDGRPMVVQRYSDGLLTLLLKAHRPKKFADKVDVSGTLTLGVLIERAHQMIDQERDARVIEHDDEIGGAPIRPVEQEK